MGFIEDKIRGDRSFVEIASIFRQDFVNFPGIESSMRKTIVRGGKNRIPSMKREVKNETKSKIT